jgi:hypothetical protein
MENLEKITKASGPTCQPQRLLKRLTPVTRAHAHDTTCGDATVTVRHQWPPPHVRRSPVSPHRAPWLSPPWVHAHAPTVLSVFPTAIASMWLYCPLPRAGSLELRRCRPPIPPSVSSSSSRCPPWVKPDWGENQDCSPLPDSHLCGAPPMAAQLWLSPGSPTPPGASLACHAPLRPSNHRWRSPIWAVTIVHPSSSSLTTARPPWWSPFHPTGAHGFPLVRSFSSAPPSPVNRRRPAEIGRSSAAMLVGEAFPCFGHGPKRPSGPNPLSRLGQAPLWAKPTATVPVYIFLLNYSNSILIKVQTSKIVRNWMDLIKL